MVKWTIRKSEKRYIIYAITFAFAYFTLVMPWIIKTFDGGSALFQFFVFNVGLVAFLQMALKSVITGKKITLWTALGLSILFVGADVLSPPYCLAPNSGQLITANLPVMAGASDCIAGNIGLLLGISPSAGFVVPLFNTFIAWNYLFTYVAFPALLLLLAGFILKDFVRYL